MENVDLESAYRLVLVHPNDHQATRLKWQFKGERAPRYMVDTSLPFGAKWALGIFHRMDGEKRLQGNHCLFRRLAAGESDERATGATPQARVQYQL